MQPGWYAYGPGTDEGVPTVLRVDAGEGSQPAEVRYPQTADGHLAGEFTIEATLEPTGATAVQIRLQACDGRTCEVPEQLDFGVVDFAD
ncbi:hypothetical protein [Streptomyces sp. NPDC091217]|uniref:hypothetical protein n=1 Tax=Streptomyces sp. NPDC091217 TaxID=3365975 RepID=UPI0038276CE5